MEGGGGFGLVEWIFKGFSRCYLRHSSDKNFGYIQTIRESSYSFVISCDWEFGATLS